MQSTQINAKTFSALGDKTRLNLYQMLGENSEICVSQLADKLGITPACVSQHMKVLSEVGLVQRVRAGQKVCYQISKTSPIGKAVSDIIFVKKEEEHVR